MTSKELASKMAVLPDFLSGAVMRGLEELGSQVVDLNISQMEELGEDSRGAKFGDYAVRSYEMGYPQLKMQLGREGRFINLHNEGDFHGGMDFKVSGSSIEITSKDPKTEDRKSVV